MSAGRDMLREEAKKVYKENAKKYPKRQRLPFAKFYKQYKAAAKAKQNQQDMVPEQPQRPAQDFDFNDMVSLNNISDADVEKEKT